MLVLGIHRSFSVSAETQKQQLKKGMAHEHSFEEREQSD